MNYSIIEQAVKVSLVGDLEKRIADKLLNIIQITDEGNDINIVINCKAGLQSRLTEDQMFTTLEMFNEYKRQAEEEFVNDNVYRCLVQKDKAYDIALMIILMYKYGLNPKTYYVPEVNI